MWSLDVIAGYIFVGNVVLIVVEIILGLLGILVVVEILRLTDVRAVTAEVTGVVVIGTKDFGGLGVVIGVEIVFGEPVDVVG